MWFLAQIYLPLGGGVLVGIVASALLGRLQEPASDRPRLAISGALVFRPVFVLGGRTGKFDPLFCARLTCRGACGLLPSWPG